MDKHFRLDKKRIYLYGAAAIGERAYGFFEMNGFFISGFIDKRACELEYFKGKKVYGLLEFCESEAGNSDDVAIFIAVKNVFEHDDIIGQIVPFGFHNIIYMPYAAVKGRGNNEDILLYDAWNSVIKGDFNSIERIPVTLKAANYLLKDYATIYEGNGHRTVLLPVDMLFTDCSKGDTSGIWTDISIMAFLPHIRFFQWLGGGAEDGLDLYMKYCISAAKEADIEVTEAWKANVLRNRADVYANMNDDLERNSVFFERSAPLVSWNEKGYFNLNSGKHRMAFLASKRRKYVPVSVSDEDYEQWLHYMKTKELAEYVSSEGISRLKAPVSHPYMYEMQCTNRDFYYNFLYNYINMLAERCLVEKGNLKFGLMEGIALAVHDDGFLYRALRRFGCRVKNYSDGAFEKFLNGLEHHENVLGYNGVSVGYAVVDILNERKDDIWRENGDIGHIVIIGTDEDVVDFMKSKKGFRTVRRDRAVKDGAMVSIYWTEN